MSSSSPVSLSEELKKKGEGVTSDLRRVTADMKNKNRICVECPADGPSSSKNVGSKPSVKPVMKIASRPKFPPSVVKTKEDMWNVRYFYSESGEDPPTVTLPPPTPDENEKQKELDGTTYMKQTVNLLDCHHHTFQLTPKKMNSLMIFSCTNLNIIVSSLISSIELCDCTKIKIQVLGVVPSITIDKSNGVDIYLSKQSKHQTEFATSKSGELNVNFPSNKHDNQQEEWMEAPIPEQFFHKITNEDKLHTVVSSLYSN